jgi:mono/diheme cytochrome c family protein
MRPGLAYLGAAVATALATVGCQTVESPAKRGHKIAEQWCAECHRVSPDDPSGARAGHILPSSMPGPAFMTISKQPGTDARSLRHFMDELHLPMPIYRFRPNEQDDIISYILSLKTEAGTPAE